MGARFSLRFRFACASGLPTIWYLTNRKIIGFCEWLNGERWSGAM